MEIMNGKVVKLLASGAIIDLGDGKSGFLHVSEISRDFVAKPEDALSVGQEVKVMILRREDDGRTKLSIKRTLPDERRTTGEFRGSRDQRGQRGQRRQTTGDFEDKLKRFMKSSEERQNDARRQLGKRRGGDMF